MKTIKLSALSACNWVLGPHLLVFVTLVTMVAADDLSPIRPRSLYVCVPLLRLVAHVMMGVLFEGAQLAREALVTMDRLLVS